MTPTRKGFQQFTGVFGWDTDYYSKRQYDQPWSPELYVDWTTQYSNGTAKYYEEPLHSMEAITRGAIAGIHEAAVHNKERPAFFYIPFTAAHRYVSPNFDYYLSYFQII